MTAEALFPLLVYMLLASAAVVVAYKHCESCEEAPMVVFSMFIVILLTILLALTARMPLLVALGLATIIGLIAYYAKDEPRSK
jgi:hydrogenase/urease accessory protein HupE